MEVDCEGCAGCCLDWRSLTDANIEHERGGRRPPIDDAYNLVALTRDEIRGLLDAGLADVMTPRLWTDDDGVEIDGITLASIGDRPVFFVGLRKPPKPVAPFDLDHPVWLPTCAFLDPETLQCRIHDTDLYPAECADYPGHQLKLEQETECERVEREWGGKRLLDDEPPANLKGLLLGPQALGQKLFVHPEPDRLPGMIERIRDGTLTDADRAEFVGVAAAAAPGTTSIEERRYEQVRDRAEAADSWVGRAIDDWEERSGEVGSTVRVPENSDCDTDREQSLGQRVEVARGAPETPGWE